MSILNLELRQVARQRVAEATKTAFIPAGGDPAQGGGAPGAPPDPSGGAGGGAPPPDPSGGAGAPPADPSGGAPPPDMTAMMHQIAAQHAAGAGGKGGEGGKDKKKVDVPTELYQIKKLLVLMCNTLQISIPPDMLLGDPATDPNVSPQTAAQDPLSSAAQPGAAQGTFGQQPGGDVNGGPLAPAPGWQQKTSGLLSPVEDPEKFAKEALEGGDSVRFEPVGPSKLAQKSTAARILQRVQSQRAGR